MMICRVHPNTPLPQALINFIVRNSAGLFFYCFQCQVKNVSPYDIMKSMRKHVVKTAVVRLNHSFTIR
jgi:hypothetical protein